MFEFGCADTGKGMSEKFQSAYVWNLSVRKKRCTHKSWWDRTGIIHCEKLVEKMQGEIDVVSEVEKGTTFTIHIPFKIDAEEKERKPEKEEQEQSIAGVRILLVEDNELNNGIAEFLLENENAVITKAWNGKEAADIFQKRNQRVVLM